MLNRGILRFTINIEVIISNGNTRRASISNSSLNYVFCESSSSCNNEVFNNSKLLLVDSSISIAIKLSRDIKNNIKNNNNRSNYIYYTIK